VTTDPRYDFVEDISIRNEILSIPLGKRASLAAGVWTTIVRDSVYQTRLKCLANVVEKLNQIRPEWEFWLLAAHKTQQPDNRISRYNGLWKSLQKGGATVPSGLFAAEKVHPLENGIRFFGAVRFDLGQVTAVHSILTAAQAAIAFLPPSNSGSVIPLLISQGWSFANSKPPFEILEKISEYSGLVLDVYGEFDDAEVSVAAFGKKEVLLIFS
jgi:hypothetical protein